MGMSLEEIKEEIEENDDVDVEELKEKTDLDVDEVEELLDEE